MDRCQRVERPREETTIDENEVRINRQGRISNYIAYSMSLLQRRIPGLHQVTSVGSIDITDTWEPLEEGLVTMETTRHVSMITITLSKKELNASSIGYQSPIPAELVKPSTDIYYDGGSPNGRGRAHGGRGRSRGRGNGYMHSEYDDGGWDHNQGYPRGRGRGRGRGFQGRGRGGYGGPPMDTHQQSGYNQESRGYNQEPLPRGRDQMDQIKPHQPHEWHNSSP